ncbi:MAG: isochorismatase family protein [Candidatus Bathyarchaeia archaeon]
MKVRRRDCVLIVIDVQDRIIDTIAGHDAVVENIKALIRTAQVLNVPIIATQQENLGEIVPALKDLLSDSPKFRKLTFSCCGDSMFMKKLRETRRKTIIACGIETHICVLQTVLDLLRRGYRVLLARDGTSSHALIDTETAIERMRGAGAMIDTTEATMYELMERAGTEQFRNVLEIVKERRSTDSPKS